MELGGVAFAMSIHRLTAVSAAKLTKPGLHSDGGGLYLM